MVLRKYLRSLRWWVALRGATQYGLIRTLKRKQVESKILKTRPIVTRPSRETEKCPCEVHVLTWDRDWKMALWAAKSFYFHSKVDWPLIWHEGGPLAVERRDQLIRHFPESRVVGWAEADRIIEPHLERLGLRRLGDIRRKNVMLRKLVDYAVIARARNVLSMDSDVLFFRAPIELIGSAVERLQCGVFNRDVGDGYSLSPEIAQARWGIVPVAQLNAGLGLFPRAAVSLAMLEEFLQAPELPNDGLLEQTLHALLAARTGIRYLPEEYCISPGPGLCTRTGQPLVARHYPHFTRHLMFEEGIPALLRAGFLRDYAANGP
jgi:hypothetical protein